MAGRSELGISPVLLQAIAQTLTSAASSSSLTSPRDTGTTVAQLPASAPNTLDVLSSSVGSQENCLSNEKSPSRYSLNRTMDNNNPNNPSSGGVVSHLLQNLNEPVTSLLSHPNAGLSPGLSSSVLSCQPHTFSPKSKGVLAQAGLSLFGDSAITSDMTSANGSRNRLESLALSASNTTVTSSSAPQPYPQVGGRVHLSNSEMANFLLKEEPSVENVSVEAAAPQLDGPAATDSAQNINTVSNMLSALASQHVLSQKSTTSGKKQQGASQEHIQKQPQSSQVTSTPVTVTLAASSDTSASANSSSTGIQRPQQQIIIYSYINNEGQEVTLPVSSSSTEIILGNDGDSAPATGSVQSAVRDEAAGTPATYRVLLQPPPTSDGADSSLLNTKPTQSGTITLDLNYSQTSAGSLPSESFPSDSASFSGADGRVVIPITDAQNTQDGMSQPCPVCGDKVSGYHYGIFTCESCKGFFKRTVQNKKAFVCPKSGECTVNSQNRKKCPACRFKRCLTMGMKLEAIRQDRTRGGRSSYDGCSHHMKPRVSPLEKKIKRVTGHLPGEEPEASSSQEEDAAASHRNLVAILNHSTHKQASPNAGMPQIPELLRDIMNLEPLLSDDDLPADAITDSPFPEQAVYSYMMQLAELRLYKLVRWARNLPQFGAISTDDQILLLQNCWSELMALSLCWRSIDTPNQISISSSHHITAAWAHHLGFEDVVIQLINITDCFRRLFMDQFEYVALKVLLLITPDVKGLKEPRKIRDFQDKLLEALLTYTTSHYKNMRHKFGELLLRLPELSRISFMSKDILIKSLPASMASCGLLVELLKGDNKGEGDSQGGLRF